MLQGQFRALQWNTTGYVVEGKFGLIPLEESFTWSFEDASTLSADDDVGVVVVEGDAAAVFGDLLVGEERAFEVLLLLLSSNKFCLEKGIEVEVESLVDL